MTRGPQRVEGPERVPYARLCTCSMQSGTLSAPSQMHARVRPLVTYRYRTMDSCCLTARGVLACHVSDQVHGEKGRGFWVNILLVITGRGKP